MNRKSGVEGRCMKMRDMRGEPTLPSVLYCPLMPSGRSVFMNRWCRVSTWVGMMLPYFSSTCHAITSFGTTFFFFFAEVESGRASIERSELLSSSETMRWEYAVPTCDERAMSVMRNGYFKVVCVFCLVVFAKRV